VFSKFSRTVWVLPTHLSSTIPEEGAIFVGIKRPEREASHSPSVEVKKAWSCVPWRGA